MLDINTLTESVKIAVIHDKCADGTASAILLHDALPKIEIRFVQYGTKAHKELKPEPGMLFVDFSPFVDLPKEDIENNPVKVAEVVKPFVDAGAMILDHHKTAKLVVQAFGDNGRFGDETADPGVCGAMLVYQHIWLPMTKFYERQAAEASSDGGNDAGYLYGSQYGDAEDFATLAGIRDTWLRKNTRWLEACYQGEALRFYPNEHWLSVKSPFVFSSRGWWREQMALGRLIFEKHQRNLKRAIEGAFRWTSPRGTRVIVFEGATMSSDAAEMLDQEVDLVVGFNHFIEEGQTNPILIFSTRSHTHYDCSALAKYYGGGGHTKAAGFNNNLDLVSADHLTFIPRWTSLNPYTTFQRALIHFEDTAPDFLASHAVEAATSPSGA
jgi:hypothetical protein